MGDRRLLLTDPLDGDLKTVITLLSEETTDETTSSAIRVGDAEEITFWVVYDGVVSGGEVTVESALIENYAGTWTTEDTSTGGSNKTDRITVRGIVEWIRVRISDAIAGGGNVTIYMAARGSVRS